MASCHTISKEKLAEAKREILFFEKVGWSDWVTIMVPCPEYDKQRVYKRRACGDFGYYIEDWEEDEAFEEWNLETFGIFEFRICKGSYEPKIVYVQNTYRQTGLKAILNEYIYHGDDEDDKINIALREGFSIQTRLYSIHNENITDEEKRLLSNAMREVLLQKNKYLWNTSQ